MPGYTASDSEGSDGGCFGQAGAWFDWNVRGDRFDQPTRGCSSSSTSKSKKHGLETDDRSDACRGHNENISDVQQGYYFHVGSGHARYVRNSSMTGFCGIGGSSQDISSAVRRSSDYGDSLMQQQQQQWQPLQAFQKLMTPFNQSENNGSTVRTTTNANPIAGCSVEGNADFATVSHPDSVSNSVADTSNGDSNGPTNCSETSTPDADSKDDFDYQIRAPPPPTKVEPYEGLLANAMQSMSLQERERAYEEIHGVSPDTVAANDQFLQQKLQEVHTFIANKIRHKPAYEQAMLQNPAYVRNPAFVSQFLHAEDFRVPDAARRYVRHFEAKYNFFGKDRLTHDLAISSLDPDAQSMLPKAASVQALPMRDTSGRLVLFSWERYHRTMYGTGPNVARRMAQMFWFYLMSLTEDESCYRKGFVYIAYGLDIHPTMEEDDRAVWWNSCIIANAIPIRCAGLHYCYNDARFGPIVSLLTMGFPRSMRSRIRVHYGTHQEIHYALMSFGIAVDTFPITSRNEWKTTQAAKWLDYTRNKEAFPERYRDAVYIPQRTDVLLGRGKPMQKHPGNQQFHDFVVQFYDEYNSAKRKEKNDVAQRIVDLLKATRTVRMYIKDDYDMWVPATDDQIRDKVCHSLRRNRRMEKACDDGGRSSNSNSNSISHGVAQLSTASLAAAIDCAKSKRLRISTDDGLP